MGLVVMYALTKKTVDTSANQVQNEAGCWEAELRLKNVVCTPRFQLSNELGVHVIVVVQSVQNGDAFTGQ